MSGFDHELFMSPSAVNKPIYNWIWNGPVDRETTDSQLAEMQRMGVGKFCIIPEPKLFRPTVIPTELNPDYLTDAFMEEIRYAMDKSREMGMQCWLYDEGGWPSGGACGAVLKKHPEYARRNAGIIETEFPAGSVYKKSREDIAAAFANETEMLEEGYLFTSDTSVSEYYSRPSLFENRGISDFPDLTLAEATDCFIELTHEKYASYLSDLFGNQISALFTDEPTAPRPFPFREDIVKAYEAEYNESPLPALPALCSRTEPDEKTAEICIKWYDLCSKLFCQNFLGRCKAWANAHNLKFTGHMDIDHIAMGSLCGGNFHLPRSLRMFDIPGIDVIWRHIFPKVDGLLCLAGDNSTPNNFFPRYASSAAVQIGSKYAMTESLGVYGNGVTFEQMRFIFGFQAIRGVNVFNLMHIPYKRDSYLAAGEPPTFREDYACFSYLSEWNRYLERLSYVTTSGDRVCDIALYYPIRDIWSGVESKRIADNFEKVGAELEEKQIDFDIIDDDILENATGIEKGVISFGNAAYSRIVLPECRYLSEKSKRNLESFKANGGEILNGTDDITPPVEIACEASGLIMMHRKSENQDIYCFFNQNSSESEFTFDFNNRNGFIIDINEGRLLPLNYENGLLKLTLCGGETCAVCLTDNIPLLDKLATNANAVELDGEYSFRRLKELVIKTDFIKTYEVNEVAQSIKLGDWTYLAGEDFSGSALYKTCFEAPEGIGDNITLDLGDVCYTAEVILNGVPLGKRLMSPYLFTIPKDLLTQHNSLEIIVTNTAGNQFQHTDAFDIWPEWMLTPYFEKEKRFDKDSFKSGLFGPVRILY